MTEFFSGALTMAGWTAGLFFLRFWRLTHDRLFLFFCLAFWALALNWIAIGVLEYEHEPSHHAYWLRLLAFALILAGIIDKNWRKPTRDGEAPPA